jgi:hypothetical protein
MIRAIVAEAKLSSAEAAAELSRVIIERRNKVVRHWISGVNPLDFFEVRGGTHGPILLFDNAATRNGITAPGESYQTSWSAFDNMTGAEGAATEVEDYSEPVARIPLSEFGPADPSGARYTIATIRTVNPAYPQWRGAVRVTLRQRGATIDVVGIDRGAARAASMTVTY